MDRSPSDAAVDAQQQTREAGRGYVLMPVPRERQPVLDRLVGASRRFTVHALLEVDVTGPRARIVNAEPRVSWTGFVIASVARAVALHPEVNARKAGNMILYFHHVDIGATVERHRNGRNALDVVMIQDADQKPCSEISEVLRCAKHGPAHQHPQRGLTGALVRLPGPLRRATIRIAATRPRVAATFGPAVGVTSLGMFTRGWAGPSRSRR